MLNRHFKEPFGKAGLTVAILALVLAMVGGAWAAVGLNGKQKKEVRKIAKTFAGKPGVAGQQGPAAPAATEAVPASATRVVRSSSGTPTWSAPSSRSA